MLLPLLFSPVMSLVVSGAGGDIYQDWLVRATNSVRISW